jgi:Zn-dependent M28 family amino/carboxypeptidase
MSEKTQKVRRITIGFLLAALLASFGFPISGQAPAPSPLAPETLRQWLTVISSDEFEGRATFSPGLDRAAYYIADRLKDAGVKPGGENGSYFQPVAVQTIQAVNQSTLVVEVNGETRTFRNGEGVYFPSNVGGKRTFTLTGAEFVGYGLNLGSAHNDYADRDVRGKAVVWMGDGVPSSVTVGSAARMMESRTSMAIEEMGAAVSISPAFGLSRSRERGGSQFVTTQRLDLPRPIDVMVSDEVFALLFSKSSPSFETIQAKALQLEDLHPMKLDGVKMTFTIDADYKVINTKMTQNVIGLIEGSDPQLKSTYVAFGAHYDHLGVEQNGRPEDADHIYNGADDDGSGSTALIALAHAFMKGPRPLRSLMFAWHAGEEKGLWGSQYLVDHPPVPIDDIAAQINIDMIGRNRDNLDSEENSVYAVGADRISTELHNVLVEANNSLASPMDIDFEMNDPADPERIYFRSDHFSYAAKGIPIIFFFTGLHPDYHRVTDSVDKIHFEKMSRITRLIYELGMRLANMDHAPARDFKGPRMGKGSSGKIP